MLSYFNNKNFLITGHNGFKGSWLTGLLKELGANTTGLSNGTSSSSFYLENKSLRPDKEISIDIRDRTALSKLKEVNEFDGVFHLAAQALVQDSYRNPLETFDSNILGTANVLDFVIHSPRLKFFLCATTDKVYQSSISRKPYEEIDQLGAGDDPYSASKVCVEYMLQAWKNCLPQDVAKKILVARAGNVIGGGDISPNRLMPDVINALESNVPIVLRNPSSIRPWQHVLDPILGYLCYGARLGEDFTVASVMNFGPNSESAMSVLDIINHVQFLHPNLKTEEFLESDKYGKEAEWLNLNSDRANEQLGWRTQISPLEAVELTLEWQNARMQNSAESVSKKQIQEFLKQSIANLHL